MEGFTGRSSLLYHLVPPTQTHQIERVHDLHIEAIDDGIHHHRLVKTGAVSSRAATSSTAGCRSSSTATC